MCMVNENLKTAVLGQACPTVQWHQEGMVVGLAMLTYVHGAGLKDDVFRGNYSGKYVTCAWSMKI